MGGGFSSFGIGELFSYPKIIRKYFVLYKRIEKERKGNTVLSVWIFRIERSSIKPFQKIENSEHQYIVRTPQEI